MTIPRGLSHVPRHLLEEVLDCIERGRIECPLSDIDLQDIGVGTAAASAIAESVAGFDRRGTTTLLQLVLAERVHRPPPRLDLVWSGPEARGTTSRDTALVLKRMFDGAERSVLIAGYTFDTPAILEPLHRRMKERNVQVSMFVNIEASATSEAEGEAHARKTIDRFLFELWNFGPPRPSVFYDPRTAMKGPPWVSMHAKCVVVDEARTLITSANFTERAQERNIEVGVLIEDPALSADLVAQWRLLIAAGVVKAYGG